MKGGWGKGEKGRMIKIEGLIGEQRIRIYSQVDRRLPCLIFACFNCTVHSGVRYPMRHRDISTQLLYQSTYCMYCTVWSASPRTST